MYVRVCVCEKGMGKSAGRGRRGKRRDPGDLYGMGNGNSLNGRQSGQHRYRYGGTGTDADMLTRFTIHGLTQLTRDHARLAYILPFLPV